MTKREVKMIERMEYWENRRKLATTFKELNYCKEMYKKASHAYNVYKYDEKIY